MQSRKRSKASTTSRAASRDDPLSGSRIENVFVEALYADVTIAQVRTGFVPLSKLMAEQITGLRNWSKGRARLATSPQAERLQRLSKGHSLA